MDKFKRLRIELRETLFKVDELESRLDSINKEMEIKDKQIGVQNKLVQHLRDKYYKSVELCEYQVLKEKLETKCLALNESQNKYEFLNKKLNTELQEIELLHNKNDLQLNDINKLKTTLNKYKNLVEKQNIIIKDWNKMKESRDYYKQELEKVLADNCELREIIGKYKEEENMNNELNISVDDLNQSFTKFFDSMTDNNNGESMDSVIDIKCSQLENDLEEKKKSNEELQYRLKLMSKQLNEYQNRIESMKNSNYLTETQTESNVNEKRVNAKEKESFDKIFGFFEKHFLIYIPLNAYFVPFGKRVIFTFTPKFFLRLI